MGKNGLDTQERINDICKKCGMSEEIVRRVLNAEKDSVEESLKKGERATMIGRCTLRPEIKRRVQVGGTMGCYVRVYAEPSTSLQNTLSELNAFEKAVDYNKETDELMAGIKTLQLESLM